MGGRLSAREAAVKSALDDVRARCDLAGRRQADPVRFAHAYADPADREIVALVAACVAFGNVKAIGAKIADLLARLGPHPARCADRPEDLRLRLAGWKHRIFRGTEVARLLGGARALQRRHGSLGALFEAELARRGELRAALAAWCDAIRAAGCGSEGAGRRALQGLLPDPLGPSGNKRLLLFLRWMVRPSDGVDLGLWHVDASRLLMPVDVHVHRLAKNLGFTRRRGLSWKTTEEITAALARFDAADPVGYDFSLCHMGMVQHCPSRRDADRCQGCGVKPVCIHWDRSEGDSGKVARRAGPRVARRTARSSKPE